MRRSVTTGRPHVGWARLRRIALLIGAVALVVAAPIMALVALAVKLDSRPR